jgi:hypothetical protein
MAKKMKLPGGFKIINVLLGVLCVIILWNLIGNFDIKENFEGTNKNSEKKIKDLTDKWIIEVTKKHNPEAISKMFCSDGNLVGTVSQIKRQGKDIKTYFKYFAKLPGIKVINKKYNISQVTDNVFINTAFITWSWDGLQEPVTARMTFTFRDDCIYQLHSSALPDLNKDLVNVSGNK